MSNPLAPTNTAPLVSVIMAHHDGAPYFGAAIASVLCQSLGALELILSDDASTDGSRAIALAAAANDPRVKVFRSEQRGGPGVARNHAINAAKGEWIAIVDADDLIHPERLERLIRRATSVDADVVADDLIPFGADQGRTILAAKALCQPWRPTTAEFLAAETGRPALPVGYLKPLIRRSVLGQIRYRPYLTVGEDFDLLLRVLLTGASFVVVPEAMYLYRRHSASISHRLGEEDLRAMLRAIDDLRQEMPAATAALAGQLKERRQGMARAAQFAELVRRMKARDGGGVAGMIVRSPSLIVPLVRSFGERVARRVKPTGDGEGLSCLELACEVDQIPGSSQFRRLTVPAAPSGWSAARAAALVAEAEPGNARLRAHGRAGLDALGYLPGWANAELFAPSDGWTKAEAARIAALPWPVTCVAKRAAPETASELTPAI